MGPATGNTAPGRQAVPPLPDAGRAAPQPRASGAPPVADGCYLIHYTPEMAFSFALAYEGTLRVETTTGRTIASGDLYERSFDAMAGESGAFAPSPDPKAGIPIFPIDRYRYYLRVTDLVAADGGFSLTFEALQFRTSAVKFLNGNETKWLVEDVFTARMGPVPADVPSNDPPTDPPPPSDGFPPPAAFPSPALVFVGDVANGAGMKVGTLRMGSVSPHLRKATVEINRVSAAAVPQDSGVGETWQTTFAKVGWDITLSPGDSDVAEPSGGSWNKGEADAAMQARRAKVDLNKEWHYDVLAVRRIDQVATPDDPTDFIEGNGERGYMYDRSANMQGLGLMVASDYKFPDTDKWGLVRGKYLGTTVAYLRTAVHELGHAMGLGHNEIDNGFMNPTNSVAENGRRAGTPFPTNMVWSFSPDDAHRLRHWPDLIVRPGGLGMPPSDDAPVSSFVSDRLRLDVAPASPAVPFGAPVRIHVTLTNVTDRPLIAPDKLSLKSGFVRGRVIDASGAARTFSSFVVDEDHATPPTLDPGTSIDDWLTLLQGADGALFPAPGAYRIVVEATWRGLVVDPDMGRNITDTTFMNMMVTDETRVTVTPPVDAAQADAARAVLATPDTLLALALGGDHLKDGIAAIGAALKSDVLRPHFAYVEAKRLATRFFGRMPDLKAAADLIDATTVMSPAEFSKAVKIVKSNAESPGASALAQTLKARAAKDAVSDEVKALVRDL
jgi:hypothetical protein